MTRLSSSAVEYAIKLLEKRDLTQYQLVERLKRRGFTSDEIEETLAFLRRRRILDDRKFSFNFVEYATEVRKWGKLKIVSQLRKKGVDETTIAELEGEWDYSLEKERAYELANKYIRERKLDLSSLKDRRRLANFLYNRGFEYSIVLEVIEDTVENRYEI